VNNSVKHWPTLLDVNDCSFGHLTLIQLRHYLVKCRNRSSAIYNNEFILGSACIGSNRGSKLMGRTIATSFWDRRCFFLTFVQHLEELFFF